MTSNLLPKLLVSDADAAIHFYCETLNATLTVRVADAHNVHHAELALGSSAFALAQAVAEWGWHDPHSVGGSPVLLTASVPDPDATADRMVQLGAELLIPVENRTYGKRQGRVRDPFGHLWVISGALR